MTRCPSCGGLGGGTNHKSWCAGHPGWTNPQRGHHRLAAACVAVDCDQWHEALQVHNHGTEDGPGLACNEGTLGACQLAFLQADAVRNAASMFLGLGVTNPNQAYNASRVAELLQAFANRYGSEAPAGGKGRPGAKVSRPLISGEVHANPPAGLNLVKVCPDCGSLWEPVRRGECIDCGSDRGPVRGR